MAAMQKFSLLIFSRNDVDQALDLVKDMYDVADEIVLMDASDSLEKKKLRRAKRKCGKKLRVFDVIALGYSEPLRMYAHKKCRYRWVLRLDTDEGITESFKRTIGDIISGARCNAFAIRVHDVIKDERAPFFAWQVQLYKKNCITFRGLLHEQARIKGKVERLTEDDTYIEHLTGLRHTATTEYPEMEKFHRMSYRMYNRVLLDYVTKFRTQRNIEPESAPFGKILLFLLLAYERLTFRDADSEISNFDYFVYYTVTDFIYLAIERRFGELLTIVPRELGRLRVIRKWRAEPDGEEVFEISKVLSRMGLIRFLELDNEAKTEALIKKYKGGEQGVGLLMKLLKEKYEKV